MDKSTKLYTAAMNKYHQGYIEDALELSEKSISLSLRNTAAINLKGLIYYLKGELENAQRLWKLNYQVNRDGVAQKYLENSKNDEERERLYREALGYIKQLNITEALENLKQCALSDYNTINVNNYLTVCYIKIGQYELALECVQKVLNIDKKNKAAKENCKILKKFGGIAVPIDYRPFFKAVGVMLAIVIVVSLGVVGRQKLKNNNAALKNLLSNISLKKNKTVAQKNAQEANKGQQVQKTVVETKKQEAAAPTPVPEQKAAPKVEVIFPAGQVQGYIKVRDMVGLYETFNQFKDKELQPADKDIFLNALQILKTEGVPYFYNQGTAEIGSGEYSKAKETLLKAYRLGGESDLYPHIVYASGNNLESAKDIPGAIQYYSEYDAKYPSGNYEPEVLYRLATLNQNIDKEKAKLYAQKLVNQYANSIYNNSIISGILNQ